MRRRKIETRKEAIAISVFIGILFLIIGVFGLLFFIGLLFGGNPIVSIVFIGGMALYMGIYCTCSGIYIFAKMVKKIKSNDTDYDHWI